LSRRTVSTIRAQNEYIRDESFINSWSAQYMSTQAIPPLPNNKMIDGEQQFDAEDGTRPYKTVLFSKAYLPFFTIAFGLHLLFVAYSSTQNMITTIMGTGATIYIGLIYLTLMISSIFSAFWISWVFQGNLHLSMLTASIVYTTFLIFCILRNHVFLLIVSTILGCFGPPFWVAWGGFIVTISKYIAELDFIKDTENRLHKRYKSTPETFYENDKKIKSLTQKLFTKYNRLNQLLLTTEQVQRLQVSTSQITAMLTSIGSALIMLNVVVGGILSFFLLSANTTTNPITGETTVNSTPLFILFLVLSITANFVFIWGFKTAPKEIYAPVEAPIIINQDDVILNEGSSPAIDSLNSPQSSESSLIPQEEPCQVCSELPTTSDGAFTPPVPFQHDALMLSPVIETNHESIDSDSTNPSQTNTPNSIRPSPYNGSTIFKQNSNLSDLSLHKQGSFFLNRTNSKYLRSLASNSGVMSGNGAELSQSISSVGVNRGNSYIRIRSTQLSFAKSNRDKSAILFTNEDGVNNIDGLDLDNLPNIPDLDDIEYSNLPPKDNHRDSNFPLAKTPTKSTFQPIKSQSPLSQDQTQTLHQSQSSSSNSSLTLPPPKKENPLIMALNSVYFMYILLQERVIYLSLITWFQTSLPNSLMFSLFSANIVKPTLGSANVAFYMCTIAITGMSVSIISSRLMKTFKHARYLSFVGTAGFIMLIGIIFYLMTNNYFPNAQNGINGDINPPGTVPDQSITLMWLLILFCAVLTGINDSFVQTGVATALGMLVEAHPLIRSAGFGLNSFCKSCGSIFVFFSAKFISFYAQLTFLLIVLVLSFCFQLFNYNFHQDIHTDDLLRQHGVFTEWSSQLFTSKDTRDQLKDNAIETSLDELE
jgi:hypothetical protein